MYFNVFPIVQSPNWPPKISVPKEEKKHKKKSCAFFFFFLVPLCGWVDPKSRSLVHFREHSVSPCLMKCFQITVDRLWCFPPFVVLLYPEVVAVLCKVEFRFICQLSNPKKKKNRHEQWKKKKKYKRRKCDNGEKKQSNCKRMPSLVWKNT